MIVALSTQRNALQMLADRVALIVRYLYAVSRGAARRDDETLRMIASLAGTLPSAVAQTLPVGEVAAPTQGPGAVPGVKARGTGDELELEFMTVRSLVPASPPGRPPAPTRLSLARRLI